MAEAIKIAIIGDYNFSYNSHQATNLAIDHSSRFLEVEVNYYWIKIAEAAQFRFQHFEHYDGIWLAPGPYQNAFFLNGIIRTLTKLSVPVLLTGESLRSLVEVLVQTNQLNGQEEKLISENLVEGNEFEKVQIIPNSKAFIQLYENHSNIELTSARFSMYPQLINALIENSIDIEAYNQFDEPEIFSLKNHKFFLAMSCCPQISSTREIPHPVIYTFIKMAMIKELKLV